MTSNDLTRSQLTSKEHTNEIVVNSTKKTFRNKNKNTQKGGASQAETVYIDDE